MRQIPVKIYEDDRKRFFLVQARMELIFQGRLTQADVFRKMLEVSERELDTIERERGFP